MSNHLRFNCLCQVYLTEHVPPSVSILYLHLYLYLYIYISWIYVYILSIYTYISYIKSIALDAFVQTSNLRHRMPVYRPLDLFRLDGAINLLPQPLGRWFNFPKHPQHFKVNTFRNHEVMMVVSMDLHKKSSVVSIHTNFIRVSMLPAVEANGLGQRRNPGRHLTPQASSAVRQDAALFLYNEQDTWIQQI